MPQLYMIVPVGSGNVDPGFGRPGGGWNPTDPGYGHPEGGHPSQPIHHPGHPDHGLPSQPGHPGNRPPGSWGGGHPDNSLPGSNLRPDQLPVFLPVRPDNTLPLPPGVPARPGNLPVKPGEIWPPLPPNIPAGKVAVLVLISGVGYRYTVIDVPPPSPDQGLPPGSPGAPDQGLPQPPQAQPKFS